jgi:hypothetical protein
MVVGAEVVLGSSGSTSFTSGTIVKLEGDNVTIEYGEPNKEGNRSSRTESRSRAWFPGVTPDMVKPGDTLACRHESMGTWWSACQLKSIEGSVFTVVDDNDRSKNLPGDALMRPDPVTQKDIKDQLERERKMREWDESFRASGKPARPANWKPKASDKILIAFGGSSWYPGTVKAIKGNKFTVHWDTSNWSDSEKDDDEIAPFPRGPAKVKPGQFVLGKGTFDGWDPYKVEAVEGDIVSVSDRSGDTKKLNAKQIVAIE